MSCKDFFFLHTVLPFFDCILFGNVFVLDGRRTGHVVMENDVHLFKYVFFSWNSKLLLFGVFCIV